MSFFSFSSPSFLTLQKKKTRKNVLLVLRGRRRRGLGGHLGRNLDHRHDQRAHQPQARDQGGGREAHRRARRGPRIDRHGSAPEEGRGAGAAPVGAGDHRPRHAVPLAQGREARRGLCCCEAREARALARGLRELLFCVGRRGGGGEQRKREKCRWR